MKNLNLVQAGRTGVCCECVCVCVCVCVHACVQVGICTIIDLGCVAGRWMVWEERMQYTRPFTECR